MKKSLYLLLLLALLVGGFVGAFLSGNRQTGADSKARGERRILYYVDPMNPSHTSKEPGSAPCGMALEPVYADEDAPGEDSAGLAAMPPGTVRVSPQRQQMVGVRTEAAEVTPRTHTLRTIGRVAADENRTYRIVAGDEGWMWNVHEATTGSIVKKDQLLGTLYNYLFLARQQQYLYALDLVDRKTQTATQAARAGQSSPKPEDGTSQERGSESNEPLAPATTTIGLARARQKSQQSTPSEFSVPLASFNMVQTNMGGVNPAGGVYYINDPLELAKLELYNLGISDYQLEEIARARKISKDLEVRSPVAGIVLSRNASPQQKFQKGAEIFRVADISRVWVLADVFWREANQIRPGMRARVSIPEQDTRFEAVVTDVPSQYDVTTRALRIRLEADNPDLELRPDMFVDVDFIIEQPPVLTVPASAVLDTGLTQTVFVSLGDGFFQPRAVKIGWRSSDRVQIREGLMAGEQIVISGNFLINSESRMQLAATGFSGTAEREASCEMPMPGGPESMNMPAGSSSMPMPSIKPAPVRRVAEPSPAPGMQAAPPPPPVPGVSRCPVCGMIVYEVRAKRAGRVVEFDGKTYYLCSSECKTQFSSAPERYLPKGKETTVRDASSEKGMTPND